MNIKKSGANLRYTPEQIENLQPNQIFVFGSNKAGLHIGGAARIAYEKFGAEYGNGEGLQGQSYALPTLDEDLQKLSKDELAKRFLRFLEIVLGNPYLEFLLTKVGCGIAGYSIEEVRDIFWQTIEKVKASGRGGKPANLIIPKEFDRD